MSSMFDGLWRKGKFYSKCKTRIKLTKTRVEFIRKKRNAMLKYLNNDIADLLKSDQGIDAYRRAGRFLVELNISSCYDFIEQFCECIGNHLVTMNKQRECPEECKEAVSSLMLAAARFADLPELRELRSLFSDRYGSCCLESFANKEFVQKLKLTSPTKDMKLQLLQNIALESGIELNSKDLTTLEQSLSDIPRDQCNRDDDSMQKINGNKAGNGNLMMDFRGNKRSDSAEVATAHVEEDKKKQHVPSVSSRAEDDKETSKSGSLLHRADNDDGEGGNHFPKPNKPRSVRRRRPQPPPRRDEADDFTAAKIDKHGNGDGEEKTVAVDEQKHLPASGNYASDTEYDRLQKISSLPTAGRRGHARSSSLQPEMLQQQRQPTSSRNNPPTKILDYDDFMTRLAALRENRGLQQ